MGEVKTFRVTASFKTGIFWNRLTREVRALKLEDALEKVYMDVGSHHRVKRRNLKILKVEVVEDG